MLIEITSSPNAECAYTWCVTYQDGTRLPEFDEGRPDGRGFAEVNRSQVKIVEIQGLNRSDLQAHRVSIPEGAEPVFFRRKPAIAFQGTDAVNVSTKHCIGWKSDTDACYLFVFDDGSTMLSKDLMAV